MRAGRKELRRVEGALGALDTQEAALLGQMASSASEYARLTDLQGQLERLGATRTELESAWLEISERLDP